MATGGINASAPRLDRLQRLAAQWPTLFRSCRDASLNCRNACRTSSDCRSAPRSRLILGRFRCGRLFPAGSFVAVFLATCASSCGAGGAATGSGKLAGNRRCGRTVSGSDVAWSVTNRPALGSYRTSPTATPASVRPLRIPMLVRWMPVRWRACHPTRSETSYQIFMVIPFSVITEPTAPQAIPAQATAAVVKKCPFTSLNPSVMFAGYESGARSEGSSRR